MYLKRVLADNRPGPYLVPSAHLGHQFACGLEEGAEYFEPARSNWSWLTRNPELASHELHFTITRHIDRSKAS